MGQRDYFVENVNLLPKFVVLIRVAYGFSLAKAEVAGWVYPAGVGTKVFFLITYLAPTTACMYGMKTFASKHYGKVGHMRKQQAMPSVMAVLVKIKRIWVLNMAIAGVKPLSLPRQVLYDQLLLNSPRAGRQQG